MSILIAGLIIFIGVHSVSIVAPGWRDGVANRIGRGAWKALYSLVAIAGLLLIIRGYAQARGTVPVLYVTPLWMRDVTLIAMVFVFPLVLAAYFPGPIRQALKHPMLAAVKLWAFAHLLVNGSVADVVLFGSLLGWAVADRISLNYRIARAVPAAPSSRWNNAIALAGGFAIYAAFVLGVHAWLIGVPVVIGASPAR